ncbi:MAG: hypothetical protein WCO04_17475 [Pseudomonadota bacterium]
MISVDEALSRCLALVSALPAEAVALRHAARCCVLLRLLLRVVVACCLLWVVTLCFGEASASLC